MLKPRVGWRGMDRKNLLSFDMENFFKLDLMTLEHFCYTDNNYCVYELQFSCHIKHMHFLAYFLTLDIPY